MIVSQRMGAASRRSGNCFGMQVGNRANWDAKSAATQDAIASEDHAGHVPIADVVPLVPMDQQDARYANLSSGRRPTPGTGNVGARRRHPGLSGHQFFNLFKDVVWIDSECRARGPVAVT